MSTTKYKERKRAQRAVSLRGKRCANCGATTNLQRHSPSRHKKQGDTRILCQTCQANLHVRKGTWAWMGK